MRKEYYNYVVKLPFCFMNCSAGRLPTIIFPT